MGYIANIVTKSKLETSAFFNVTSDFNTIDTSIPTLIIGWSEVKENFPNQDILNSKINDTISWTFSKREKRFQYEKDVDAFINKVVSALNDKIKYRFFNFLLATQDKRASFISYVQTGNCSIYYNSRFLYVYNINDSFTIGVSLTDLEYIGINTADFIRTLTLNNNNIICDNLKCVDSNSYNLIKDNAKIIAYLNYLRNSDIYKEKDKNG
jgi:hypothetical protein